MLPRIYGYILLRVRGDVPTAEDLTQDTLLAFARASRDGVTIANPPAWLFGTARHKVIDHLRTRSDFWTDPFDETDHELAGSERAAGITQVIDRARLLDALDRLPDVQRLAILLRYTDGLTVRETAALLNRTEHATETHLVRARRTLRTLLTDEETR
jgi:RNA polymerase sigma-70 factor (ECF subfamily)